MADQPPPAPSPELLGQMEDAKRHVKEKNVEEFKREIENSTKEQLDALAYLIKQESIETNEAIINAIRERVETLTNERELEQQLTHLENRVYLVELLSTRARPQASTQPEVQRGLGGWLTDTATAAGGWVVYAIERVLGALSAHGTRMGGLAYTAYAYVRDNSGELARWLGSSIKRGFYTVVASPALLGFDPSTIPFAGKAVEWAKDRLARLDAIAAIEHMVSVEKTAPSQNNIEFDGKFSERAWVRWSPEKRSPDKVAEMTRVFIDEQRKLKNANGVPLGAPVAPIKLTMDALIDPEEAQRLAEEQQTEEGQRKEEQFKTTVKEKYPDTKSVTFGDAVSAVKEGDKWVLIVPKDQLQEDSVEPNAGSKAEQLRKAMQELKLPNLKKIVIADEGAGLEIRKDGTVTIPQGMTAFDEIKTLVEKLQPHGRLSKLQSAGAGMPTDKPRVKFNIDEGVGILLWNQRVEFSKLATFLTKVDRIDAANTGDEWYLEGDTWKKKQELAS